MKIKLVFLMTILGIILLSGCIELGKPVYKECEVDSDCLVFGENGDCNCGCFNKDYSWKKEGDCFCAAPKSCKCVNGVCEGIFEEIDSFEACVSAGYPMMESYPRQCSDGVNTYTEVVEHTLTPEEALAIAEESGCTEDGELIETTIFYNNNTKTWWIDLDIEKEGCNPACVVSEETRTAEINWRCTGLTI